MLIENAIKHNVLSSRQPLEIRLSVEGEKYLMIENTLQEKQNSEPSTFIGLRNLRQRYQFISNAEVMIQKSSDRFLVKIPLIKLSEI
jgi:LytS/YehU family sensor histidine kinase